MRRHYEAGEIGIQGQRVMGDAGISDVPEFPDDMEGVPVAVPSETEDPSAGKDVESEEK